ncbi:MAG TPA: hypothetical protein VHC20_03000 [Candidatus Paceibacterota bacterium]|nr:hypothetical protein [Candidatus Paceibacterota bacterium]
MAKRSTGSMGAGAAAGLAAVGAAAAAGYYFYASDDAKKHRTQAAKWANGFKDEVLREAKQLQNLDARSIARAVDAAAATYAGIRSIDSADLVRAAQELKSNWQRVESEVARTGRGATQRAKKSVAKPVKKARKAVAAATRRARAKKR